jgi:hypothetical protein
LESRLLDAIEALRTIRDALEEIAFVAADASRRPLALNACAHVCTAHANNVLRELTS